MSLLRQTRLGCFYCNEFLVGKRSDDAKKNCFGFSYGPRENPFLIPKLQKNQFKPPNDPVSCQSLLLKCGHVFHKGCVRKSIEKPNGCVSRVGQCPICKKSYVLGQGIEAHLQVQEDVNVVRRRNLLAEENETKRLAIRTEIDHFQKINVAFEKGFDKARQSIMSDSRVILKYIRDARQRKRILDEFQKIFLDPLEDTLDEIYEENVLWKQLLGEPIQVDDDGFIVPRPLSKLSSAGGSSGPTVDGLPCPPPKPDSPLSPEAREYFRSISSPIPPPADGYESDYSDLWKQIPTLPPCPSGKVSLRPDPDLLPNGLYEEPSPPRDSDDEYDIGVFSEKVRKKLLRQEERHRQRQVPLQAAFDKMGIPVSSAGKFVYTHGCVPLSPVPLPEEHWEESGSELVSDYELEGTSVYGSAELEKRCDVDNILDPDRALRKWRQIMAVTLKFSYKFEQRKINWDNFPEAGPMSDSEEDEILDFINNFPFH